MFWYLRYVIRYTGMLYSSNLYVIAKRPIKDEICCLMSPLSTKGMVDKKHHRCTGDIVLKINVAYVGTRRVRYSYQPNADTREKRRLSQIDRRDHDNVFTTGHPSPPIMRCYEHQIFTVIFVTKFSITWIWKMSWHVKNWTYESRTTSRLTVFSAPLFGLRYCRYGFANLSSFRTLKSSRYCSRASWLQVDVNILVVDLLDAMYCIIYDRVMI